MDAAVIMKSLVYAPTCDIIITENANKIKVGFLKILKICLIFLRFSHIFSTLWNKFFIVIVKISLKVKKLSLFIKSNEFLGRNTDIWKTTTFYSCFSIFIFLNSKKWRKYTIIALPRPQRLMLSIFPVIMHCLWP